MQVMLLPWLQFEQQISIRGITVLTEDSAFRAAGDCGNALRKATSYFFESSRKLTTQGNGVDLVHAHPSAIILDDTEDALESAQVALDGIFFACMLIVDPYKYANATNFVALSISALSENHTGFVRIDRTLFGSKRTATQPEYSLEVRPHWCAEKTLLPDSDNLALYEEASHHPEFGAVRSAIAALLEAMTDAPMSSSRYEFENYARAVEHLLHRPSQNRSNLRNAQKAIAKALIEKQISGVRALPNLSRNTSQEEVAQAITNASMLSTDGILDAMLRVREDRNASSHPGSTSSATLRDQLAVRPNLVAFRVVSALMLSTMAEFAPNRWTPMLRAYVAATAQWTSEYEALKEQNLTKAIGRFGQLWSGFYIRFA